MSSERAAWLAERMHYVTASDVAAAMGMSPYKTRDQLKQEKLGYAQQWEGNEQTEIALELEGATLMLANRRYGWRCIPNGLRIVMDPQCPWLAATPDATMATPWGTAVVQVKWTTAMATEDTVQVTKRGKPSTAAYKDGPPLHHQLQVQAEMACLDVEHGVLLVMHHGHGLKLRPYYIPRSRLAIRSIRRHVESFWKEIEQCRAS